MRHVAMAVLAVLAVFAALAALEGLAAQSSPRSARSLAREVTIERDRWGVPHVHAPTDAGAVFGFAYAQAEDGFPRLEENFIRALGRSAELYGDSAVGDDRLNRALEIPRLAREEYRRLDPRMRALCDAFAAGVNHYLATHPDVRPQLLARIEPWYPLAFIRYNYYQNGFVWSTGLRPDELQVAAGPAATALRDAVGSNGWVIAPSRSATGRAMLFVNPHLPFFGPGQVYEGHLRSDEGWNFTGYARFGFPFPYVGHNDAVGWVSTDNAADQADLYRETFDDSARPLAYRHGGSYRTAVEWTDTIRVRTDSGGRRGGSHGGMATRVLRLRRTHHGPVVAVRDGQPLALRMAKLDGDGWLGEWYAMTRARSVAELRRAMEPLAMLFGNVMAADTSGHIWYLYNGAVPRRDPRFDWSEPVDGSDPAADWRGYHTIDELPELLDPPSGWMQNCNSSPFALTDHGNPDSTRYPRYMVPEAHDVNPRARAARRILAGTPRFTFDEWARAAFDLRVTAALEELPALLATADSVVRAGQTGDPALLTRVAPALALLREWDGTSGAGSVPMTVFVQWRRMLGDAPDGPPADPVARLRALAAALELLDRRYGSWRIAWGETHRLQRVDDLALSRAFSMGGPSRAARLFADSLPSLPLPAVDGRDGAVFTASSVDLPGQRRQYAVAGASYVSVVEFGPAVRALAVHTFGTSADPRSPHWFDQAPLYARGEFRPAWFTAEEVRANRESTYHPGDAPRP